MFFIKNINSIKINIICVIFINGHNYNNISTNYNICSNV